MSDGSSPVCRNAWMEIYACRPKIDHEHWLRDERTLKRQPLLKREEGKTVGSWEIKEHHHWL